MHEPARLLFQQLRKYAAFYRTFRAARGAHPLNERERIQVDEPYILIVPSYGGGGTTGAVPRQVIRFLNDEHNRALLRGVIASGNRNFGEAYGRAGDVIARKCGVPWLYRFELMGTQSDIENVRKGVTEFWQRQPQNA